MSERKEPFDPAALRAQLEQLEATMRDTFVESAVRMGEAAKEKGANPWLANDIAIEWLVYLMGWLPGGGGRGGG